VKSFVELDIKRKYASKSENTPLDFYNAVIPISKNIYFKLGYFSSYAISILALPLTHFLLKNGTFNIVTNHVYRKEDAENLLEVDLSEEQLYRVGKMFMNEPEEFKKILQQGTSLFYDCLNYLQSQGRLVIQPVLFGEDYDLSHYKEFVAEDFAGNHINANGSCNLTPNGILRNGESFTVIRSWDSQYDEVEILNEKEAIKRILNGIHPDFEFANSDRIVKVIHDKSNNKELNDLLDDAKEYSRNIFSLENNHHKTYLAEFEKAVESYKTNPRRPDWFSPRDYQIKAYRKWLDNNCQGIFSMATGTGKTLTAINIMLEESLKNGFYRNIILVPTRVLANQWQNEIDQFNFSEVIKTVDNKDWYNELSGILRRYSRENFIVITTYANFNSTKFQGLIKSIPDNNGINIVADEMHNLGSSKSLLNLPLNIKSRLGLSATPERIYDDIGNQKLSEYFSSFPPCYTYSFSMKKAIDLGRLCEYEYYPILVYLSSIEIEQYLKISKQLLLFFDSETGKFKDEATSLLLKRKRIIHKAEGKKNQLRKILKENKNLTFTFIYVPEGFEPDYSESDSFPDQNDDLHLLNEYINVVRDFGFKAHRFTGQTKEKERVLNQFAQKKLDVLLAMKCLDEGVNVPRTEIGIFCSSTGNPRQFIQRRGRILRTHEQKSKAIIYDLIVAPPIGSINTVTELDISTFEKSLFTNELRRVANFAYAAKNLSEIFKSETFQLAESIGIN